MGRDIDAGADIGGAAHGNSSVDANPRSNCDGQQSTSGYPWC